MPTPRNLRLLASTNNERGDLFTRLVSDLFYALGYDDLRFDVHKTGREIDIEGSHRHEPRRVVAECKAHAKKMGGSDLNKILGAVTREREKGQPVTGYLVSLSGFSQSGIEQELNTDEQKRIIPIDSNQVIDELTKSNILISKEKATERAGRCAEYGRLSSDTTIEHAELLGHSIGYIWALFYACGKERTHFALVHADGTPLTISAAKNVLSAEHTFQQVVQKLTYLPPPPSSPNRDALAKRAMEHYCNWLAVECGEIQLDGLPADTELTSLRMRLEKLFVPLKLELDDEEKKVVPVGSFLNEHKRFSILATPGGGKSTLLKRLAVAYADPTRRTESDDQLPDCNWLPLFLRCRDLRERSGNPIRELLCDLGRQAEMEDNLASSFKEQVHDALKTGRVLLLIDGLDEFSDATARTIFAGHLRTFLGMFPQTALIVTSREAGFRQIAGVVASVCKITKMATFNRPDVRTLCERWSKEVIGDSEKIRQESHELAETIWNNERIRALAENPLMLTTLLVVRRNVGELPTKRVKLYHAAVNVLIRTWNVEGFEPLNEDETLARLSYVAVSMMKAGQQRIGKQQLLKLLRKAQTEMDAELQYAEINPNDFIDRIEYRSSLLMRTGHQEIDGQLEEIYEFRHLTFQEYLAARGLVEEQFPGRDDNQSLAELLEPHFKDDAWLEVIALAATLAGRKAEPLVQKLTKICDSEHIKKYSPIPNNISGPEKALQRCILDEVQTRPKALRDALHLLARYGDTINSDEAVILLLRGKFGPLLREIVVETFFGELERWEEYYGCVNTIASETYFGKAEISLSPELEVKLDNALISGDRIQQGLAAFAVMQIAFRKRNDNLEERQALIPPMQRLRDRIAPLLNEKDAPITLCVAFAFVWTGAASLPDSIPDQRTIIALYQIWKNSQSIELRRFARWALSTQLLYTRETFANENWRNCDNLVVDEFEGDLIKDEGLLTLAWYRHHPWSDEELITELEKQLENVDSSDAVFRIGIFRLLEALGKPGQFVLRNWRSNKKHLDKTTFEIKRILGVDT